MSVKLMARSRERDLLEGARAGEEGAVRAIVQQNNRRLFRVARSILKNDAEAEDAVQEAYIKAFGALDRFQGESSLATWLTRIVANEALSRLRRRVASPAGVPAAIADEQASMAKILPFSANGPIDPERAMAQREITAVLEREIDSLPDEFRIVLVARLIEEMSVEETAALFDLKPQTVKTRLHRARALLRARLERRFGPLLCDAFPFGGRRCERMTQLVLSRLAAN